MTGFTAFTLSLPVAAYCLYGFGFAPAPLSTRTLVHSVAGCAFYGGFAAKVLLVHTRRSSGLGAPGGRRAAAHRGGGGLADQRPWFFHVAGIHR